MDINIIGPGVVGKATGEAWKRFGHNIEYTDVGESFYIASDLFVICTPEDAVESALSALEAQTSDMMSADIVVRSSTPPGTVKRLAEKFGVGMWHNPEFLREATAEQDVLQATYALIGYASPGEDEVSSVPCETLDEIYAATRVAPFYCSSTESEFVKLATNCYLATQISFWNEIKRIADKVGLNSHSVAKLATLDPRVSSYGADMHGKAYGGKCLPKDMRHMEELGYEHGLASFILGTVQDINLKVNTGRFFE